MPAVLGVDSWKSWVAGAPTIVRWVLVPVGIAFAMAGLKPRNGRPWRDFLADASGLRFPSECPETRQTEWLLIPWSKVGDVRTERFHDRSRGVLIEMQLTEGEIRRYFEDVALKNAIFHTKARDESGSFRVGYSSIFQGREKAVAILNRLKAGAP